MDDSVWPLPVDTKLRLRFGGTIKYTDRYIELERGRARATLSDGGSLASRNFSRPVEYDQFFGTFDRRTRASLGRLIDTGGPALSALDDSLPAALDDTPPAFAEVEAAFRELGGDQPALDRLARSTDAVVDAVRRSTPSLADLVSNAAATFNAVASEATALRRTLAETPSTLGATRRILAQADGTLARAATLTRAAAPGVSRLRGVTTPLADVLGAIKRVSPEGTRTLKTLRRAAPDLDEFLDRTTKLMPQIGSIGRQGAKQLACVRPYSPEIAGFFSNWGPGAWGNSDGKDTYLRGQLGTFPFPDALPFDTKTFTRLFPHITMPFPRPPGDLAHQPWYQPRCGVDQRAYDPTAFDTGRSPSRGSARSSRVKGRTR
jgi:phospholipid/cholesterol/gamma-HCH transport system substrate-binding protein